MKNLFYGNLHSPRIFGVLSMRKYFYVLLLAISAANVSFCDEVTAKAQQLLNELGYDAGPVDGLMGNKEIKFAGNDRLGLTWE